MEQCSFCKIEKLEDDFYMYSIHNMTRGRVQKGYVCKSCSDMSYGDKWYPIIGYDEKCEISNDGIVRELRENRYFNITTVQNAGTSYVYLTKNGKNMKKNIRSLMKRFCTER
ncbi:hypothetical protein ASG99_04410 [Bacillus sp. Soil768D1]|nr:hypothetical protein ASG99_04410 [Bacillus sp. Soil768D1]